MIRLIGALIMFAITASGYMYIDFKMSAKWSGREDAEGLTFTEYLSGLTGRIAGLTSASAASGLPTELADMLPKPPEGWTARPVVAADVDACPDPGRRVVNFCSAQILMMLKEIIITVDVVTVNFFWRLTKFMIFY